MVHIARGWELDIERGPDWLFVRPHRAHGGDDIGPLNLAEEVCGLLEQNFIRRVVLELDQIGKLDSYLVGQLIRLHTRIYGQGGMLRLCGLSSGNQSVLEEARIDDHFVCYTSRTDAVKGYRPVLPR